MAKNYRDSARDLKRLGLVNYDLRRKLSSGQKANITKQLHRLADVMGSEDSVKHLLRAPKEYKVQKVTARMAQELADSGYKVLPNRVAVVPKHGFEEVKIRRGKVILEKDGMTKEVQLVGHKDFFPTLEKLSKKKLKRGEFLSVSIGDNSPFVHSRLSYADLYKYLSAWEPKDPGADKRKLMAQMSIVTVKDPAYAKKKAPAKKARRT